MEKHVHQFVFQGVEHIPGEDEKVEVSTCSCGAKHYVRFKAMWTHSRTWIDEPDPEKEPLKRPSSL